MKPYEKPAIEASDYKAGITSDDYKNGVTAETLASAIKKCIHCGNAMDKSTTSTWDMQCEDCENSPLVNSLQDMTEKIHLLATEKGWWDKPRETGTVIALIHSELSEALEADRNNLPSEKIPPFTGVEEEMADFLFLVQQKGCYKNAR